MSPPSRNSRWSPAKPRTISVRTNAGGNSGREQSMSTRIEEQIRADIVDVGRSMYARGYVGSNDGNIGARRDEGRLITPPTAVSKGYMTPDMMVIVDYDGNRIAGER